jgi:hypothetical protein
LVRGSAVSGVNVVGRWLAEGFVSLAAVHLRRLEPGVGLERIWRTTILPLLEELHYGDPTIDVPRRYGLASLRTAISTQE